MKELFITFAIGFVGFQILFFSYRHFEYNKYEAFMVGCTIANPAITSKTLSFCDEKATVYLRN